MRVERANGMILLVERSDKIEVGQDGLVRDGVAWVYCCDALTGRWNVVAMNKECG